MPLVNTSPFNPPSSPWLEPDLILMVSGDYVFGKDGSWFDTSSPFSGLVFADYGMMSNGNYQWMNCSGSGGMDRTFEDLGQSPPRLNFENTTFPAANPQLPMYNQTLDRYLAHSLSDNNWYYSDDDGDTWSTGANQSLSGIDDYFRLTATVTDASPAETKGYFVRSNRMYSGDADGTAFVQEAGTIGTLEVRGLTYNPLDDKFYAFNQATSGTRGVFAQSRTDLGSAWSLDTTLNNVNCIDCNTNTGTIAGGYDSLTGDEIFRKPLAGSYSNVSGFNITQIVWDPVTTYWYGWAPSTKTIYVSTDDALTWSFDVSISGMNGTNTLQFEQNRRFTMNVI